MARPGSWVHRVATTSNALDLPQGLFTRPTAHAIALGLKRSAHASTRRKAGEFQSAMSMLNYHINRGGRRLPPAQKERLEAAKDELRKLYGRPTRGRPAQGR